MACYKAVSNVVGCQVRTGLTEEGSAQFGSCKEPSVNGRHLCQRHHVLDLSLALLILNSEITAPSMAYVAFSGDSEGDAGHRPKGFLFQVDDPGESRVRIPAQLGIVDRVNLVKGSAYEFDPLLKLLS
jgi:hypothetical protein